MSDGVEDRYLDVLQNIELAIVSVYQEKPDIVDSSVDRALESLIRLYNAEISKRARPALRLGENDQLLFDRIYGMCEWRLGRSQAVPTKMEKNLPEPKRPEEMVTCLKRIRSSVKHWTKIGGRQGYLNFVSQYVG
jgi:hypothetical protein